MKPQTVSKSQFKAKALEYMRLVQSSQKPLIVTDMGNPVIQVIPYKEIQTADPYEFYKGSVLKYDHPDDPVALEDWEALKWFS